MSIRKKLAKKIYWRESRIRRIAENILSKYAKIVDVNTRTKFAKFAGRTGVDMMPYYMAEYISECAKKSEYYNTNPTLEEVYSPEWSDFQSGVTFEWGKPSEKGMRILAIIRYPHAYDSKWKAGEYTPEAKRMLDSIRYIENAGWYKGPGVLGRSHIEGSNTGRLITPPRFIFRDFKRVFEIIVDIAREKGYY